MYNSTFFASKLGNAAIVSIAAMVAMILLSSQIDADSLTTASMATPSMAIELA